MIFKAGLVRVKREGGRGHHLINSDKYNADPGAYVLCDEEGKPLKGKGEKSTVLASGQATLGNNSDPAAKPIDLMAMTAKQLHALAAERGVDLGKATKKADMVACIEAAAKPAE